MKKISPKQIYEFDCQCVDVRNYDEYEVERLNGTKCVPLDQILSTASNWNPNDRVLLMCKSGMRSAKAAKQLEQVGFANVFMVEGGLDACKKAGLEVIKGRKSIPLFRQLVIVIGIFLLAGLSLTLLNQWFLVIPTFVAIMLVISGITGFCPMMKILERMPWNAHQPYQTNVCCSKG